MYLSNIIILCVFVISTVAVNHLVLNNDGRITQKVDSPFYMREPDNLIAFLDQIRYNDYVETTYLDLLRQREQIVEHLRFSVQFGEDLVEQAKCAVDYYLAEKRMSHLKVNSDYLKRFSLPKDISISDFIVKGEPICGDYVQLAAGPCCYDHLESFQSDLMNLLRLEREEDMVIAEYGTSSDIIRRIVLEGFKLHPKNWGFHTLSSYYWRLHGNAKNALECARIGVMLAPRSTKDISLLSLGTILFRMGRLNDAEVILSAAVEHAPDVAENHMTLASALAMKHDFNRSTYHFDEAERLNPSLLPRTVPVRNFMNCLDNLTKKTAKMYSYVEYMKNEVKEFKRLKYQISRYHEKIIQQQVPLGARLPNSKAGSEEILKRGQYCSTRTSSTSDKPVLFCDFYSDIQMRLESRDVDIESLERDIKLTSEAVIKQVSTEFRKQLNLDQLKSTKAQAPGKLQSAKSTNIKGKQA